MTEQDQKKLGDTLWGIADDLRGRFPRLHAFLRYRSDNYEAAARKELGGDYPS